MFSLGASAIGAEMQNRANRGMAREANAWAREANSASMAFQERMSNTAHQREVNDLRLAGLNPILSANGGASTPSAPAGSGGPGAAAENVLGSGISSAMDAIRLRKEVEGMQADIDLKKVQGTAAAAAAMRDGATARQAEQATKLLEATYGASAAEAKTRKSQAEQDYKYMIYDNLNRRIQNGLNSVNSAKDAVLGLPKGVIRTQPNLRKNQIIINDKTGEIIQP